MKLYIDSIYQHFDVKVMNGHHFQILGVKQKNLLISSPVFFFSTDKKNPFFCWSSQGQQTDKFKDNSEKKRKATF